MKTPSWIIPALAVCAALAFSASTFAALETRSLAETLGVVHSGGRYRVPSLVPTLPSSQWPAANATEVVSPTDPDRARKLSYLEEGAYLAKNQVGTRVLKLFANKNMVKGYAGFTPYNPWRTTSGSTLAYTSLTDMLDEAPFKNVLDDTQFAVVIINATNFTGHWSDVYNAQPAAPYDAIHGVDSSTNPADWDPWIQAIYSETKDLTTYLLTTYGSQGRTFVLQNWEGDNDINLDAESVTYPNNDYCATPIKTKLFTTDAQRQRRVDLFTAWIKARQAAVAAARAAYSAGHPTATSHVYCALEITLNPGTYAVDGSLTADEIFDRNWCALNKVVPNVALDLYSWSNWTLTKTLDNEHHIFSGLDYYRSHLPAVNPYSPELAGARIYLGEFGCYELKTVTPFVTAYTSTTDGNFSTVVRRQMEYALKWGVRFCAEWTLLDNGVRSENKCAGIRYDYSDFLYPMAAENAYQGANGLYQNALTGVWVIRGARDVNDASDHSFPAVYGTMLNWLHRKEYADELADKTGFTATQPADFLITTSTAAWNGHDNGRLYLAANPTDPAITYQVAEDLQDLYVRVYLSSSNPASPVAVNARFKYQTSTTADFTGAPLQDFSILHEDWLDKKSTLLDWNEQNWKAYDLGPGPTALPSGTRYVRIVFQSSTSGSNAQLGSVRLYTSSRTLTTDELTTDVNNATSGHRCDAAINLAWTAVTSAQTDYNIGRAWSANASQGSHLTYRVENLAGFSFRVYHTGVGDTATTLPAHVVAWVGYTDQESDLVPLVLQVDTSGSNAVAGAPGWYSTKVKPADLMIQGARYLVIGFDPTARGATDTQIGAVALSELKEP